MATSGELIASGCFAGAVVHTFLASKIHRLAHRFNTNSAQQRALLILGEVELAVVLWSALFLSLWIVWEGGSVPLDYVKSLSFTEPVFVFVIMTVAASRPIIELARLVVFKTAKRLPVDPELAVYFSSLTIGPFLGSFITEPAAMTVTAFILLERYYNQNVSERFRYITLGILFVNISIGGALTHFAAPPVLLVADRWGWDSWFMLGTFGWKVAIAVVANAVLGAAVLRKELTSIQRGADLQRSIACPPWLILLHFLLLIAVIVYAHHPTMFLAAFAAFLLVTTITKRHQEKLILKQSIFVALFLGGLVLLGGKQSWWLTPILSDLPARWLYLGAATLTAITDNAAITYLGSQLPSTSADYRYAIVAGALIGGGLTVIANAPNPAGFAILQKCFGPAGIRAFKLARAASIPTAIAGLVLFVLWN